MQRTLDSPTCNNRLRHRDRPKTKYITNPRFPLIRIISIPHCGGDRLPGSSGVAAVRQRAETGSLGLMPRAEPGNTMSRRAWRRGHPRLAVPFRLCSSHGGRAAQGFEPPHSSQAVAVFVNRRLVRQIPARIRLGLSVRQASDTGTTYIFKLSNPTRHRKGYGRTHGHDHHRVP